MKKTTLFLAAILALVFCACNNAPKESKEELHFKKTVAHGKKSKGEQNNDLRLCRYNSYGKLNRISAKTKERKRQTITISVMG